MKGKEKRCFCRSNQDYVACIIKMVKSIKSNYLLERVYNLVMKIFLESE